MASLAAAKLGVRNAGRRVGPASPTSCPRTSRWKNEDGGQVIVLVAVAVAVLLGIGGLVLDIGMAMVLRGDEQRAADAAALAGATEIFLGGTVSDAELSAQAFAEENGYDSAEVVVRVPPKSGKHIGDPNYVEVSIRRTSRPSFIRLPGVDSLAVTARGVAGLNPLPGDYALIVLNRTACKAYDHTSSSNLTIKNGAAIVNSSCEPSAYQGGGSLVTGTHLDYYVEGAWQLSNNATAEPSPTIGARQPHGPHVGDIQRHALLAVGLLHASVQVRRIQLDDCRRHLPSKRPTERLGRRQAGRHPGHRRHVQLQRLERDHDRLHQLRSDHLTGHRAR